MNSRLLIRLLITALLLLLLLLQYSLWVGEGSLAELNSLEKQVLVRQQELNQLRQRNQILEAEVKNLRHGRESIEERARTELGMIKRGEIFYQIIRQSSDETQFSDETQLNHD